MTEQAITDEELPLIASFKVHHLAPDGTAVRRLPPQGMKEKRRQREPLFQSLRLSTSKTSPARSLLVCQCLSHLSPIRSVDQEP
jgi:hypothetical protein